MHVRSLKILVRILQRTLQEYSCIYLSSNSYKIMQDSYKTDKNLTGIYLQDTCKEFLRSHARPCKILQGFFSRDLLFVLQISLLFVFLCI